MTITDEMVEAGAKAIWDSDTVGMLTWDEANQSYAEHKQWNKYGTAHTKAIDDCRRHARACLTAALEVQEAPLDEVLGGAWTQITITAGPMVLIEYEVPDGDRFVIRTEIVTGPTIDAAIREAARKVTEGSRDR